MSKKCYPTPKNSRKIGYALFLSAIPGLIIAIFVHDIQVVILLSTASAALLFLAAYLAMQKKYKNKGKK